MSYFPTLAVLGALLIAGLLSADEAKISIRGEVKQVSKQGTLSVEGVQDKTTDYDKASVRLNKDTKIFISDGKKLKAAKAEDVKLGVQVEIWFTGPVAESYPVQATAGKIVILPAPKKE